VVNERIDDKALETRSNNNYGESDAMKEPMWYAKDMCAAKMQRKHLDVWTLIHGYDGVLQEWEAEFAGAKRGRTSRAKFRVWPQATGPRLGRGSEDLIHGAQVSLKLLLLLLELLKLGFSVRLVGIETAPAFSETHAESSFAPPNPTLPLLFAERVPTAKSQREVEVWWVGLFPTKVGSLEGRVGVLGVEVFCGAFFDVVVLLLDFEFELELVSVSIGVGFDVVLLAVTP